MIKNGHVIDPANRTDQTGNIAVYDDRITRYGEGKPARHVVGATGRYVFPGLIDTHTYMSQEGAEIDIHPDVAYLPIGVVSAIDPSVDVTNYPILRSAVITRGKVTIKSFLQVCSAGLTTTSYHECINPKFFNPGKIVHVYHDNQDSILGLRVRQSEELAEGLGIKSLKEAVRVTGMAGCPMEVRYTNVPVPTSGVLKVLCSGDIFEHTYQGAKNTIINENGKLYDRVREARKRGIISDTAKERKYDDSDVIFKAKEQGFIADMCSTDLVLGSMFRRPIFSLPNLMSQYICMGIPIGRVVSTAIEHPAGLMKMQGEIGCLSERARTDVVIFRWTDFKQTYKGWKGAAFTADKLLKPEVAVKDGQIMYCAPGYVYED